MDWTVDWSNPYLDSAEIKIYQEVSGKAQGYFTTPYKHPRFKIPGKKVTDISIIIAEKIYDNINKDINDTNKKFTILIDDLCVFVVKKLSFFLKILETISV